MTLHTPITQDLLTRAKWAFSTRRVRRQDALRLNETLGGAVSGDLVLGRVESIGSHKKIQLAEGRASELYVGDLVVLACGARYAPDQFEGLAELDPEGADMLAGGGVLGRMRHRHARMSAPTRVVPLGLLTHASGRVMNLASYALPAADRPAAMMVIGVVGASMNSGKTTAVARLAHGLSRAGHQVAAIKATGTGAFGDFNAFSDTGASYVADFTDAGMVSTYRQPLARIEAGLDTLLAHAEREGCEVAVVELADGVFQKETADLLKNPKVRDSFAGVLFAAPDALAAAGGCAALRAMGVEPAVVTGMVSCSPLGAREAEAATGVRVVTRDALSDPAQANALLARLLDSNERQGVSLGIAEVGVAA
ncbi:DUF1611 domain-containing protein [Pelagibius litoralis]|uniref:DUF1611 domain-containing protein n=1 Tax=Pelagibius litoralis TaxID=374515 RepID=A0A967F3P9_9PROT|nr:DUF1611 domain-containing protein [Pelagibius litoralis]NIA72424.1 DUF1611 domain-containing protein [Pelagibius litoralis]